MQKQPRIIELPSKPTGKLTPELGPAYERPLDSASVGRRMKEQLAFEGTRFSPRTFSDLEADSQTSPNWKKNLRRKLAIGMTAVVGAAGTVLLIERAYDQQQTFYQPSTPGLSQGSHK